jgi:predicted DNA-binding transcriptional regulator AlpA
MTPDAVDRRRCYTVPQLLVILQMKKTTFFELRRRGELPFLEELRPRLGRFVRYRADLVDRYLENQFEKRRRA